MPLYNGENTVAESIEGIVKQSYTNWELLITDDGSNDNSVSIVTKYQQNDDRIKLFKQKNSGAAIARNNSIKRAKGKYIAFCDSDDIWKWDKLEKQVIFMKCNDLSFTYSSYQKFISFSNLMGIVKAPQKVSYESMLKVNHIGCLTAIYDAEELGKRYFSSIPTSEDYEAWLNIFKDIRETKGLNEVLAYYRIAANSISRNKFKAAKNHWKVLTKINELGKLRRIYCFCYYAIYTSIKYLK